MMTSAQPPHIQRLAVVVMMGIHTFLAANLAGLTDKDTRLYRLLDRVMRQVHFSRRFPPPLSDSFCLRKPVFHGLSVKHSLKSPLTFSTAKLSAAPAYLVGNSGKLKITILADYWQRSAPRWVCHKSPLRLCFAARTPYQTRP